MNVNLRAIGGALWFGSTMAALVAVISITGDFSRVWPGTILAFISGFGSWLMLFGRWGGEHR